MTRKKMIAGLMSAIMVISMLPQTLFANPQKPLDMDGIKDIVVQNKPVSLIPGADVEPSVSVQWNPISNDNITGIDFHDTKGYSFQITDSLYPSTPIQGERKSYTTYQDFIEARVKDPRFTTGRLYKLKVVPFHEHITTVNGETRVDYIEPPSTSGPTAYFMSDFNTKVKDTNGKIEVSWEYIPGAQYEIVYIAANRKTVEEIENQTSESGNKIQPATIPVTSSYASDTEHQTMEDGTRRVTYVLDEASPGQIYSIYVKCTGIDSTNPFGVRFEQIKKNTKKDTAGPKVVQATPKMSLRVFNVGANDIRLEWTLASWLKVNPHLIKKTYIKQRVQGNTTDEIIGEILTQDTAIEYYQYTRPTKNTNFYVEFHIEGLAEPLRTQEFLYIPSEAIDKPLRPQVPKPFNKSIDVDKVNIDEYKVLGDDIDKKSPNLIQNTFHAKEDPASIQLVWDAPKKQQAETLDKIDYGVEYDIYVVEERNQLREIGLPKIAENVMFSNTDTTKLILKQDGKTVVGFKHMLDSYIKQDGTKAKMIPNKTYTIQIVAKRKLGEDYISSDATIVSITIPKKEDIFNPPVLAKPPLKLHSVTKDTATIRWLTNWGEIYVKDEAHRAKYASADPQKDESELAENWNSVVYTGASEEPYIHFKNTGELKEHILKSEDNVAQVKNALPSTTTYGAYYVDREVTLGTDSKYEVKVFGYEDVVKQIEEYNKTADKPLTLETWIMKEEADTVDGWETIAPWEPTEDKEPDQLPWLEYTKEGLTPNTRYVILIRAYRELGDGTKLNQTFPSYVICTTESDFESPEEIPKVPVLNYDTHDDTSITVWWKYNKNFDYELVYGRLDDPDSATVWDFEISDKIGDPNYVTDGAKLSVKIAGLFPDTTYNVWVRAKQKKGSEVSNWSNPVTKHTDTLQPPEPPTGLGPAAYQSILEIGKDFKPVDKDYITVEWTKNPNDIETKDENTTMEKNYYYVLEFADNPEFLDSLMIQTGGEKEENKPEGDANDEILAKNMVRINKLISNRPYYVRVKTVLSFKESEGDREIIKESEFTRWVRILTKKSDDEYDGGDNDEVVTYPEAIEETYEDDIWTWEIVDTNKIISDIVKKQNYYYSVKMQDYNKRYDAKIRRVKMPKAVVDALINKRMELRIITNKGIYDIPVTTLQYYLKDVSAKDIVQFDLTTLVDYEIMNILRSYPEKFLKGEQLTISVYGSKTLAPLKRLDGYMNVKLKLDGTTEYMYKSLRAYTYNIDTAAWVKADTSADVQTDVSYLSYKTPLVGMYALYEYNTMDSRITSTYSMSEIAKAYNVEGLGTTYSKNTLVHSDQYTTLLLGIAQNKSQIDLYQFVYDDTKQKAKQAGIYISSRSGYITEEQAIAGIVRLYELRNGQRIKPSSIRFSNVSKNYKEAVAKAYAIGLTYDAMPNEPVTYAKLCDWLIQIL